LNDFNKINNLQDNNEDLVDEDYEENLEDDEELFKVERTRNSKLIRTQTAKSGTTERS
jgi:hypothetical protein